MKIAIVRERFEGENRVAATPETVGKLIALGASVAVEQGAGLGSRILDKDYTAAGATIAASAEATLKGADVVLTVRRPTAASLAGVNKGALVIGALDPYGNDKDVAALAKAGVTAISMEFMPRITRAQVMDILSSQANLAGYQGVIEAAAEFDRAFPMMMTAAGTVRPAKAFVMGAGVAGLQAIATAKRLGAVVSATDVRPAAKEQVESLGGKFIAVEDEEFKQAETAGGYAKQMSAAYQAKQAELTATHIAKQDIVITTALIPGRPAPRLITKAMVESMAPGSVIVDLAAERGGNVELTVPGKIIEHNGVKIVGYTNVQGRIPTTASQLYARNLLAFLTTLIDAKEKQLAINWDDELVKATVLTRDGAVVHPSFAVAAPVAEAKPVAVAKAAPKAPAKTVEAKAAPIKTGAASAVPAKKAPAKKTEVAAMADTPKKAAPGVAQSIPVAAAAASTPAKSAATRKAAAVIDAAAAVKPAAHVEDHASAKAPAARAVGTSKPATKPAEHVENHAPAKRAAIKKASAVIDAAAAVKPSAHIEDHAAAKAPAARAVGTSKPVTKPAEHVESHPPAKRAAIKKADAVIDATAAAKPADHVEDHAAAQAPKPRAAGARKPATKPAAHVEDHAPAKQPAAKKPAAKKRAAPKGAQ